MRYLLSEERCNKAIPVSSTGMTSSVVQFTFKNEYPYSYVLGTEMASFFIC
ncbi:hypothetical protein [Wolbachia endosymbiont (group A) of Chalcis sispes]|uniref:hypothetical protein n=1 Tax=unclassified Wolbachia TaxID=2640676 RepID=UPI00313312F1